MADDNASPPASSPPLADFSPDVQADETPMNRTPPMAHAAHDIPPRIAPPRFQLHQPPQLAEAFSGSAFATPLPHTGLPDGRVVDSMQRYQHRVHFDEPLLMASAVQAPDESFLGHYDAGDAPVWRNLHAPQVDQELLLKLNQEGDLERLTRKAVDDTHKAWKTEIMSKLRKEVDDLENDQWMFQAGRA